MVFVAKQADRALYRHTVRPAKSALYHLILCMIKNIAPLCHGAPARWHDPGNFRQERWLGIMEQCRRDVHIGEAEWCFP
jgi:hypothetical protein